MRGMKPLVNMDPLLIVLLMGISVARVRCENTHVTDFVSSLMDKNAHKRVVYLVVDCHPPGPKNAIEEIENLASKLTRSSIHVMTIPVSRNGKHEKHESSGFQDKPVTLSSLKSGYLIVTDLKSTQVHKRRCPT